MGLLLPDSVIRDVRGERAAELSRADRDRVCAEWTRELRKIDVYLEMIFWPERAAPAPGLFAGAYHIARHNPGAAASVEALVDAFGRPLVLGSWVFDKLRRADLWNGEAVREQQRFVKRAVDARDAARRREEEDRMEEVRDRANAAWRTQVTTSTDVPWSQNVSGRRGRRAA